jgi:hypothetical protein
MKNNTNYNTEYTEKNYDLEKVKKIQENYRLYQNRNIFIKKVKPSIEKKTTNYINKFYKQCELGGEITSNEEDDFSLDGWKRYYPPDERFFLYSKGEVFPNQIRLKNVDNPDKLEKLINSSRGKSKRGIININKSVTKEFKYLSSWEEKFVSYLDKFVDDVISIETPEPIPYKFNGSLHYYYADIDITLANGKRLLIEIKPTVHLYHKKNMAKFKAAQDFVLSGESNYSDYLILTENIIFIEPRKQDEIDESYIKYLISSYIDN